MKRTNLGILSFVLTSILIGCNSAESTVMQKTPMIAVLPQPSRLKNDDYRQTQLWRYDEATQRLAPVEVTLSF
jgi:hypothetical protein